MVQAINDADMVLVTVGRELDGIVDEEFYNRIVEMLGKKDYFFADVCLNGKIYDSSINRLRIATPCIDIDGVDKEKQWNLYNIWLQRGISKKLLVIELGMDFNVPDILRWPIERVVFISNNAKLIRVSKNFAMFPPEIKDKVIAIASDPIEYVGESYGR